MKNLAGVQECDRYMRHELERARIEVVEETERCPGEVPYSITGKLKGWTFRRAWYYWIAQGQLPLDVAQELWADPVGRSDVRAGGYAGGTAPETQAAYFDADGTRLIHDPTGKEAYLFADFIERGVLPADVLKGKRCVPDAPAVATRIVVESYHIDSEVGLRLFADTLRALPEPRNADRSPRVKSTESTR